MIQSWSAPSLLLRRSPIVLTLILRAVAVWGLVAPLAGCGESDQALIGQIAPAPDTGPDTVGALVDVGPTDTSPDADAACLSADATVVLPTTCATDPPPWYDGLPAPKPTLALELGTYDMQSGEFDPLIDGQWAPMFTGMRWGFGVWIVYRVQLPASTPDPVLLHVQGDGLIGCDPVATTMTTVMKFVRAPGPGNYFVNATSAHPGGACVIFGQSPSKAPNFCGQFLTVHAAVGLKDKTAWGQMDRTLRLYGFQQSPVVP